MLDTLGGRFRCLLLNNKCKQSLPGQEAHVAQVGHGERKVLASQTLLQNA